NTHHFSTTGNTTLVGEFGNPEARVVMNITGGAWLGGPAEADTRLGLQHGSRMLVTDSTEGEGFTMGSHGYFTWLELQGPETELSVTTYARIGVNGQSNLDVTGGAQSNFIEVHVGQSLSSNSTLSASGVGSSIDAEKAVIGSGG